MCTVIVFLLTLVFLPVRFLLVSVLLLVMRSCVTVASKAKAAAVKAARPMKVKVAKLAHEAPAMKARAAELPDEAPAIEAPETGAAKAADEDLIVLLSVKTMTCLSIVVHALILSLIALCLGSFSHGWLMTVKTRRRKRSRKKKTEVY